VKDSRRAGAIGSSTLCLRGTGPPSLPSWCHARSSGRVSKSADTRKNDSAAAFHVRLRSLRFEPLPRPGGRRGLQLGEMAMKRHGGWRFVSSLFVHTVISAFSAPVGRQMQKLPRVWLAPKEACALSTALGTSRVAEYHVWRMKPCATRQPRRQTRYLTRWA